MTGDNENQWNFIVFSLSNTWQYSWIKAAYTENKFASMISFQVTH